MPDAVVSFNLPDDVVRSLDATDAHALYSMAFSVELDEPNADATFTLAQGLRRD